MDYQDTGEEANGPTRIGVVSTMRGAFWGGSEELWAEMVCVALRKGIRVSVYADRDPGRHSKWEALRQAGAVLFDGGFTNGAFGRRILGRVDLVSSRLSKFLRESSARAFFSTALDVLLISEGSSIVDLDFVRLVRKYHSPRPYIILSHGSWGERVPEGHRRDVARFYNDAHAALFVAKANVMATERQLLTTLTNARVVRNPVNLKVPNVVGWPSIGSQTRFACIARLHPPKGHDILLRLLSDNLWRARDWTLSIYGSGDDETYLRNLCSYYGLNERVSFCGQTDDIGAVWRTHHALLLASHSEGMPLVVVEAMLCGRPVITTNVGGISEWVRDGCSGFLAEGATVDLFGVALERAWQRRAEWRDIGKQARMEALQLIDPAPGKTLLAITLEALGAGKPVRGVRLVASRTRLRKKSERPSEVAD